jgi:isoleucyl-tRNA synthetase
VIAGGIELLEGEYELRLVSQDSGAATELPSSSGLVVLDTTVTPELAAEGIARDLVRTVQQARREAGLDVSDHIALTIEAPDQVVAAFQTHERFVAAETLADVVTYGVVNNGFPGTVGDRIQVTVSLARIKPYVANDVDR